MCDYHLKEKCFHPQRVQKGFIALPCEIHDCEHCTNKQWQNQKIKDEFAYYQSILKIAGLPLKPIESNDPATTSIEQAHTKKTPFSIFRSPIQGLFK